MKHLFLLLTILLGRELYGQSLSVFDIDTSGFPTIKANFYAFDAMGNQILNLSPSDFEVTEDGIKRNITFVSCPVQKQPQAISSVLTIDVSGSMSGNGLNIAKSAAKMWVASLPLGKSECAITSFNSSNYFNQDFTTDSNKLISAINALSAGGGTNFNAGFINPMSGALLASENGKHKRVVVFLTDGHASGNENAIIQKANSINATVYCVLLNSKCPQILKNISTQTGGQWFENITTEKQAREVYLNILNIAQEGNPCEINWETNIKCKPNIRNVEVRLISQNTISNIIYSQPENILAQLEFAPPFIYFLNKTPGIQHDTTITVKAIYSDFNISAITSTNLAFQIQPNNFELKEGESIELTLSFTPFDSSYTYTQFSFENSHCNIQYFSFGGYLNKKSGAKTLKLTHPNGGELFVVGTDTTITWEGIPPTDTVTLEYSIDNAKSWKTISTKAAGLEYKWTNIQKPPSNKCLTKVKQLSSSGNIDTSKITWQKTYGGSGTDAAMSIQETKDNGFVVAGWTSSNDGDVTGNNGLADYWVLTTDAKGNIHKKITLGGTAEDHANSVIQTNDKGIAIAGYAYSSDLDVKGSKGDGDVWVVKIGSDGFVKSKNTYGGYWRDYGNSIYQTIDNGFIVAGYTYSNDGDISDNKGGGDVWVIKLDNNFNIQWQKTLGGSDYDIANSVRQTFDGGYILVGETWSKDGDMQGNKGESDFLIVKLDSDGDILWKKNLGGSDIDAALSVDETFDGGFVVAGETWSTDKDVSENKGMGDFWVVKLDAMGITQWEKSFGGSNYDIAYSINQTWDGGYIVAGSTESDDCDVTNYKGNIDCWVVKLDGFGNLEWQKTLGGTQAEVANSIQQVSDGGFIMAGYTNSNDADITTNKGASDFWIVKLPPVETILQEDVSDSIFSIVAPQPECIDVDMGDVLTNDIKDSVVSGFIKNIGSWKFRVDSIYFSGADASAFSLVSGFPKYEIETGNSHQAEFRFAPTEARKYQADIVIITQLDSLHQAITGVGIENNIQISNDIIDFGRVYFGYQKDTLVTAVIENVGSTPLTITNVENFGPDKKQFSILNGGGSFTLASGEKKEMLLRFSAMDLGRTSGRLAFYYNGVGSPAIAQLYAEAFRMFPAITTNSPICTGFDLLLFADSISDAEYHWTGPNGFSSNLQNIIIENAQPEHSGDYLLYTTIGDISSDTITTNIIVSSSLVSPGDSSLIYVGSAIKIGDYIKLTDAKPWDGGSVWLKNRFSIKKDFSTTFQFKVRYGDNRKENEHSVPGADGFAFVLQNHNYPTLGDKGGAMGYKGITNSLAIEFDMFQNTYDQNGNHLAVQSLGSLPNSPDHTSSGSTIFLNENIIEILQDILYFVKIEYEWSSQQLKIYIDSSDDFTDSPSIIDNINLVTYLNLENDEYVYLGFTSATGDAFQEHNIFNWVIPCNNQFIGIDDENFSNQGKQLSIFPNPFTGKTTISYFMNMPGNVSIILTDVMGNEVIKVIDKEFKDSGQYHIDFNTSELPSGVYFCTLKAGVLTETVKMLILK